MQELLDIGFAHDRTTGKEDWLTPPWILQRLGEFDLDPCFSEPRPWSTAKEHFTAQDNGLFKPWHGRVWLNPPYGDETEKWMRRLVEHGNGIALIYARTETGIFHPWVWQHANGLFFFSHRLAFYTKEGKEGGSSGAPSVLVAYGAENAESIREAGFSGKFVPL